TFSRSRRAKASVPSRAGNTAKPPVSRSRRRQSRLGALSSTIRIFFFETADFLAGAAVGFSRATRLTAGGLPAKLGLRVSVDKTTGINNIQLPSLFYPA